MAGAEKGADAGSQFVDAQDRIVKECDIERCCCRAEC